MKRSIIKSLALVIILCISANLIHAQGVGINSSGSNPDPSAGLDVDFTDRGTLLTRMTAAQRDAIPNPATGLVIYNLDCNVFNYNAGTPEAPVWATLSSTQTLVASVSISATPAGAVCQGETIIFTAVTSNGLGSVDYQWKVNGNNVGTNASTYSSSSLTNGDLVTCEITADGPCVVGSPAQSNGIPITTVAVESPTISYAGSPFCEDAPNAFVTQTGPSGGLYSATPDGLDIDPATGELNISNSDPGTYAVSYSLTSGCFQGTTSTSVTITSSPSATISYSGSPYCLGGGNPSVTLSGTAGGVFSSTPSGLSLNSSNGTISIGSSSAGSYTVLYTIAASGGCDAFETSTSVSIIGIPSGSETFNATGTGPTGSLQSFTVPACASNITIQAYGAEGGKGGGSASGGRGAYMVGTIPVTPGEVLTILVGQKGTDDPGNSGGGGGGTFVWNASNTLLVAAGGGGGSGYGSAAGGAGQSGTTPSNGSGMGSGSGGSGGNGGSAGTPGNINFGSGGAGAGWFSNGANGAPNCGGIGGLTPLSGGTGGASCNYNDPGGYGGGGGIGGGGWSAGGGGGYNGGGSGNGVNGGGSTGGGGGGGGSYMIGTATGTGASASDVRTGHGQVIISW